jgi:general secretion pathway protein M
MKDQLLAWYGGLQPREQRMVAIGSLVAVVLLLIGGLLQLHFAVKRGEERLARKQADLAWIQSVAPELQQLPRGGGGSGQSLVVIVDRTANEAGLAGKLSGTEPSGINSLRVRLDAAPFDALIPWLATLQQQHGLVVQSATIDRTAQSGLVNASVVLLHP